LLIRPRSKTSLKAIGTPLENFPKKGAESQKYPQKTWKKKEEGSGGRARSGAGSAAAGRSTPFGVVFATKALARELHVGSRFGRGTNVICNYLFFIFGGKNEVPGRSAERECRRHDKLPKSLWTV
jgi:hypothetical protein